MADIRINIIRSAVRDQLAAMAKAGDSINLAMEQCPTYKRFGADRCDISLNAVGKHGQHIHHSRTEGGYFFIAECTDENGKKYEVSVRRTA